MSRIRATLTGFLEGCHFSAPKKERGYGKRIRRQARRYNRSGMGHRAGPAAVGVQPGKPWQRPAAEVAVFHVGAQRARQRFDCLSRERRIIGTHRGSQRGRYCEHGRGALGSLISHFLLGAADAVIHLAGGMTPSTTPSSLVTGARAPARFRPADRRARATINMSVIALAADAHLAMTTPAIEQPERLPTLGHTCPTLDWTRPCGACIKELRCCSHASTATKARGGPLNRSRAFVSSALAAQNTEDRDARFTVSRRGARRDSRARGAYSSTPGTSAAPAGRQTALWVELKPSMEIKSAEWCSRPQRAFPQKQALLRHRQQAGGETIRQSDFTRNITITFALAGSSLGLR